MSLIMKVGLSMDAINNFIDGYREFVGSTINILEELNKSSSRNPYLEDLFGAAYAAIDK